MKKLHLFLAILNVSSIISLIQIIFGWIPSFECDYSIDKIDKINSLVVDISIGVITSSFFYYILVYIPDRQKRKIIRSCISSDLLYIVNQMQMILAYVVKIYSLETKDKYYKKIPPKELLKIENNNHVKFGKICSFDTEIGPEIWAENVNVLYTDVKNMNIEIKNIFDKINNINSIPNIIFEDEALISTLYNISRCTLYTNVCSISKAPDLFFTDSNEDLSLIFNFYSIIEIHSLYITLTQFVTPKVIRVNNIN